jgi:hypothetical protein
MGFLGLPTVFGLEALATGKRQLVALSAKRQTKNAPGGDLRAGLGALDDFGIKMRLRVH